MRFESAGPRTWLLAGTAAWALLALVLALFGMGGHIAPLPEDPALLRRIPALPRPAPERLGPLSQYAEIASRPLFADDRRPHPFFLQAAAGAEQAKTFDYVLTSVMITPAFQMAIIQAPDNSAPPLRIKVGESHESLPNWQLQSLDPRSAVFIGPEGERRLELRVFNGVGGEPPTAIAAPRPTPGTSTAAPTGQAARTRRAVAAPVPPEAPVTPPPEVPPEQVADANANAAPVPAPAPATPTQATEQAQMEAIRRRIEQRRAQLRREALLEQQRQNPPTPDK